MELNKFIDHTLLKPDATKEQIKQLCTEANQHKFASVCVAPSMVPTVVKFNVDNESNVKICTVIGFPHGNSGVLSKCKQIEDVPHVDEFDVVIDIGSIKSDVWYDVSKEIQFIRNCSRKTIKYIVEIGYLSDDELFKLTDLLMEYKIDFIKTCTGYGPRNVTLEDIVKIKRYVGNRIKIKASGGIKTAEFARQLIEAGADRIGTSSSVSIMNELQKQGV